MPISAIITRLLTINAWTRVAWLLLILWSGLLVVAGAPLWVWCVPITYVLAVHVGFVSICEPQARLRTGEWLLRIMMFAIALLLVRFPAGYMTDANNGNPLGAWALSILLGWVIGVLIAPVSLPSRSQTNGASY